MTTETLLLYYFLLLRDTAHLLLSLFLLFLFEISAPRIDHGRTRLRRGHPPLTALPRARQKLEIDRREWVFSNEERKVKVKPFSRVRLFATPWTVAYQDPQSMGLSRQEYWRGLPFPSPGDFPNPGTEPESPAL